MRITLIQTDIKWASPPDNVDIAERMLAQAPKSDLYVLPEMWSTGFAVQPDGIAETEGFSLRWMLQSSQRLQASLCGSIAMGVKERGKMCYRNRLFYVSNGMVKAQYDKRHLFTYGGEHEHYRAGEERVIVEDGGLRWLLLTCYDLRFPVWSRYRGDYDGIIIVANWPEKRQHAWDILLRARAIENQCYVVAVNRVGSDEHSTYIGGSAIIDPKGMTLSECTPGMSSMTTADINMADIQHFRNKFAVLSDRDQYEFIYQH